jgi:hypothetical protein
MVNMIDRGVDPTQRMSLYYTLHWLTQAWSHNVLDKTIQKCFIKSTLISPGTNDMNTSQSEDLQLGDLYAQVTDRLPGTEVMALDKFLDPLGENFDVEEPDLSDIIVHVSEENQGDDNGDQESEYDQDEYIFGPPLDILSRVEAIEYMHKALQFAQHQEGITERDLHDIERIGQLFSRLQIDGKKQRKVDDYFRPKTD